jgi:hypothetical protein
VSAVMTAEECELHWVSNCVYCRPKTGVPVQGRREAAKHNSACPGCGRRVTPGERIVVNEGRGNWRCGDCAAGISITIK